MTSVTPSSPWPGSYGEAAQPRMGFFTDTSVCIGCKACEVACKEWNEVPNNPLNLTAESFDNTSRLDADNWRHVAFVEQRLPDITVAPDSGIFDSAARQPDALPGPSGSSMDMEFRWLMESDVCKHCTQAGCLDVCPTGALFRTEFGTVVVQEDICNGCGYCVPACPFGVIDQRPDDGRVWKCTLCYDRLRDDMEPACAQACPTDSIQFGELDELRQRARGRLDELVEAGLPRAQLYLDGDDDGVGGAGAFFLLLDDPEVYGLPPDPVVPTRHTGQIWASAATAAAGLAVAVAGAVFRGRR